MKSEKTVKERISGEDRQAQIIDVALTLFAEKGFAATKTHEIAEAAGISETLIFQHFKTKDNLIRTAMAALFHPHPVSGELENRLNDVDDITFFKTIAMHFIRHNREDPRIMKLAIYSSREGKKFGELTHTDNTFPHIHTLVMQRIKARIAEGEFASVNATIAARLFIETVYMYIADQAACISGPRLDYSDEEVVDTLVSVYLHGLLKR
jgi:AcrR family transcriptional regulator